MTFAQLYNAVITRTGRTDKVQLAKDSINLWLSEFANRHLWTALTKTVDITINTNDELSTMPADYFKLLEARIVNPQAFALSYGLFVVPKYEFVKRYPNVTALGSGRPFAAYEENGVIYYMPKASQQYTLRATYMSKPVTLVDDGDVNPLPTTDFALIAVATAEVFDSIQMFEPGSAWRQKGEASIGEAILNDRRRPGVRIKIEEFDQTPQYDGSPAPWEDPFAGH